MNKLPKSDMNQVAVLGLGRFGTELTKTLSQLGCEVLAVDINEERTYELQEYATHTAIANVSEERNLEEMGIADFDGVVIAIGDDIQASIITALNCKQMGVRYLVAKASNEKHAKILEKIGVDFIIIPEADSAKKTARLLTQPQISDIITLTSNYCIAQVSVPAAWEGKRLSEINIRRQYGVNVLIIIMAGGVNTAPDADTVFSQGEKLVIGGPQSAIKNFADKLA